ncbi:hypothetical protein [Arcobacter sp.]|uniref:hypothetical protein n=1 Tax=Arcobacter sp. TaxID=1872629 RepID=UPI003D130089
MIETLLFFLGAIIVYLYSFLYRNLAVVAAIALFIVAYQMKVDVTLISLTLGFLIVMRLRKKGIRDDA